MIFVGEKFVIMWFNSGWYGSSKIKYLKLFGLWYSSNFIVFINVCDW